MPDWAFWLIAAGVLAGAETFSLDLVLIMLAGGAAGGAAAAAFEAPPAIQVLVAILASVALLVGVRPIARRHLNVPSSADNSAALVGKKALVLEQVTASSGLVKLNGGHWTARTLDHHKEIAAGSTVTVMEIKGATAVVWEGM